MLVIPAIDIKEGRVVRLLQGRFEEEKVYFNDPIETALKWERQGAQLLHIVDLDGALFGELKNFDIIKEIASEISIPVEVGGGIRTYEDAEKILNAGIERVILGTKACEDDRLIKELVNEYMERILLSVDAKEGLVATQGWTKTTEIKAIDLAKDIEAWGVKTIIYTDVSKDGTLKGPNIPALKNILKATKALSVIASGGVSSIDDLVKIKEIDPRRIEGAIVGMALYEEKIDLKEAIKRLQTTD